MYVSPIIYYDGVTIKIVVDGNLKTQLSTQK